MGLPTHADVRGSNPSDAISVGDPGMPWFVYPNIVSDVVVLYAKINVC